MTGTLDRIKARNVLSLTVEERDALVEVAKAAQEMDEKGQTLSFRLRAALARLEDNQ